MSLKGNPWFFFVIWLWFSFPDFRGIGQDLKEYCANFLFSSLLTSARRGKNFELSLKFQLTDWRELQLGSDLFVAMAVVLGTTEGQALLKA